MAAPLVLPALPLTDSGRPVLLAGEVERLLQDQVDLVFVGGRGGLEGQSAEILEDGTLIVTTHRALWVDAQAAPAPGNSTFVPLASVAGVELRATRPWSTRKARLAVAADPATGALLPASSFRASASAAREVKVVVDPHRAGAAIEAAVRASLEGRAWERGGGGGEAGGGALPSSSAAGGAAPPPPDPLDPALLTAVTALGFSSNAASHALLACPGGDAQAAALWLLEREGDASLEAPVTPAEVEAAAAALARPSGGGGGGGPSPHRGAAAAAAAAAAADPDRAPSTSAAGVGGLLRAEAARAAAAGAALDGAFTDLRALMASAADMVALAERVRAAVAANAEESGRRPGNKANGDNKGEDALVAAFEADLAALGLPSPVTRANTAPSLYTTALARQMADFLAPHVAAAGGVLPLPDAFCLFNRARGSELAAPGDVLAAARALAGLRAPLRLREFPSGVLAIEALSQTDDAVCRRLQALASEADGGAAAGGKGGGGGGPSAAPLLSSERVPGLGPALTPSSVAAALGVPLAVAGAHLATAEAAGVLCRDAGPAGVRWFRNFFADAAVVAL